MESVENSVEEVNWTSDENILFLNPRLSEEMQSFYQKIFKETTYRHGITGHIAFLTSGTTVLDPKSYKMVFLSKKAFLVSAQAVTKTLIVTAKDVWAQVLPRFHVGGLAIEARAHVAGFKIARFEQAWDPHKFTHFISDTNSTWTSLVPTQIYDLIKEQISNPLPKKFRVLVGGARLSPVLFKQAQELKWNLIPSYGMTEACSTLAIIDNETLKPLPHVFFDVFNGKLAIKTESLMTCYAQVIKGNIELTKPSLFQGFFTTEDSASKMRQGIMLLGRTQDVVKISGELVSLPKLRDAWFRIGTIQNAHSFYLIAIPDDRLENKIALVVQKDLLSNDKVKPENYQLSADMKHALDTYQQQILPFERVRKVFVVDNIPRTALGKIQEKNLLQMIEKGEAHEIREHSME